MQSPKEDSKQKPAEEANPQQEPQLSDTWRALLGLQTSEELEDRLPGDPGAQIQPLASDPWSRLLHAQGMQPVDLQKIRLHDLHPAVDNDDIEHALNIIREATGKLVALDEKTGEKESK